MRRALELLDEIEINAGQMDIKRREIVSLIVALRTALERQQEPVAWDVFGEGGDYYETFHACGGNEHGAPDPEHAKGAAEICAKDIRGTLRPLYREPPLPREPEPEDRRNAEDLAAMGRAARAGLRALERQHEREQVRPEDVPAAFADTSARTVEINPEWSGWEDADAMWTVPLYARRAQGGGEP